MFLLIIIVSYLNRCVVLYKTELRTSKREIQFIEQKYWIKLILLWLRKKIFLDRNYAHISWIDNMVMYLNLTIAFTLIFNWSSENLCWLQPTCTSRTPPSVDNLYIQYDRGYRVFSSMSFRLRLFVRWFRKNINYF